MYEQAIKEKRDKAGTALAEARRLGLLIREKIDKSETAAAEEEAFTRAHSEFTALMLDVQRFERLEDVERQHKDFSAPADPSFVHRAPDPGSPGAGPAEALKRIHREAFDRFLRHGERAAVEVMAAGGIGPKEQHALLGTQADLGGFLVPEDFQAEVIRDLAGFAVIRPVARVMPTSRSTLVFPAVAAGTDPYPSGFAGSWKPEGYVTGGTAPTVQNKPTFGQERIPVHSWQPDAIEITTELIEDSAAPLDSILAEIIAETKALDEDTAFIKGNGVGRPLGLVDAGAGITTVVSGDANLLKYNGLVDLFTGLPAQYRQNGKFLMNSATYGKVLQLADTNNLPLFPPGMQVGTLWGKAILFSEFVASVAANALAIVFGDFRYYGIAERRELRIQRLTERFAPNIGLLPTARLGGQPLRKAAFRIQKISA